MPSVFAALIGTICSTAVVSASSAPFSGAFFSGVGVGDGLEWLSSLETARSQFEPNPLLQDISQLYTVAWNGFHEGPTWDHVWTQNSYGTELTAAPWLAEPYRTFTLNSNWWWFKWIGDGTIVGEDDPMPAPDGTLCDLADPTGVWYKQGDGLVPIHDWALEESLSAVIMQAELLLVDRDVAAALPFLPLFNRTLALIESRRDPTNNLLFSGVSCNMLAPSFGAYLLPNGTRVPAYLTGLLVSYVGALDRVIELELLAGGGVWTPSAASHSRHRNASLRGLAALIAPDGDYFMRSLDPDGTMHGVLGAAKHAYIDAVVNHDAIALGVAERVRPGLNEAIMSRMLGDTVPPNPANGGPGLRPYSFVIANAASLDDMEEKETSGLWTYGTWVNGGGWSTCEARMMLAYARTGHLPLSLASMRALLGFADIFRMDSPLANWGSEISQPEQPINIVFDMFAVPAALIRSLWDPVYSADTLVLTPHVPPNVTSIAQHFPLRWGPHRFYVTALGVGSITSVTLNGSAWTNFTASTISIPFSMLPPLPSNLTIVITLGNGEGAGGGLFEDSDEGAGAPSPVLLPGREFANQRNTADTADRRNTSDPAPALPPDSTSSSSNSDASDGGSSGYASDGSSSGGIIIDSDAAALFTSRLRRHAASRETSIRALRGLLPTGAVLWLDAFTLNTTADGARISTWPDASPSGGGSGGAVQTVSAAQPVYSSTRMNGRPAVLFNGVSSFMSGSAALPTAQSTIIAVMHDTGEATTCCSGVFFSQPGCSGLSTKLAAVEGNAYASVLVIDWNGSPDGGASDIRDRQVIASIVYNDTGSFSWADSCLQSSSSVGAPGATFMIGSRGADAKQPDRYFNGSLAELLVFPRALNDTERENVEAYLAAKWPRPGPPLPCGAPSNCTLNSTLAAAAVRLSAFVPAMRVAGFADSRYELAHALTASASISTWEVRCAGLVNGSIPALASPASERAADALYVDTAYKLFSGLAAVLEGYAGSADPGKARIYAAWEASSATY